MNRFTSEHTPGGWIVRDTRTGRHSSRMTPDRTAAELVAVLLNNGAAAEAQVVLNTEWRPRMKILDMIRGQRAERIPDRRYLIWSNEHRAFWRADFCGYTSDVRKAGVYDETTANSIVKDAIPGAPKDPLDGTFVPNETLLPLGAATSAMDEIARLRGDDLDEPTTDA